MNVSRDVLAWRAFVGGVLVLTAVVAFALRWKSARLWWVVGGGLGLLLTPAGEVWWELRLLVWSVPLLAVHFWNRPVAGALTVERFATSGELRPYLVGLGTAQARHAILAGTIWKRRPWRWVGGWVALQPTRDRPDVGHGLVVAPTGLGKGLAIVTQLLQNTDYSAIVLDLKGEAYQLTSGARAREGQQIVRLDLGNSQEGHRWDPTAHAKDEDDLRTLAQALTHDPRDRDPFWAQAAEEMLTAAMLAARCSGHPVFPFLRVLFDQGIKGATELMREISPTLGNRFLAGGRAEGKMMLGIWVTLVARLRPLLTDRLLSILGGNDFSVADLRTRPTTVYITVPEAQLERLAPVLAAVWTGLIGAIIAHADANTGSQLRPLLIMLDEAGRISIPRLPGYLATLRSRGVTCLVYVQSFSQLCHAYGVDQARSISNNCALQIYYQQHDDATAWTVSKRLGQASTLSRGLTVTAAGTVLDGAKTTWSMVERLCPLLTPQQIMRLPDHTALVFYRDLPPMWINRLDWREFHELRAGAKIPPVALPHLRPWEGLMAKPRLGRGVQSTDEYIDPDAPEG